MQSYERPIVNKILQGFQLKKKLLQIITGPRQVGKTTAALQIAKRWDGAVVNATADLPIPPGPDWISSQWNLAESRAKSKNGRRLPILLILDEVQTGTGRTGKFFAYLHNDIKPDIVTLAKGLANGIPIGVMMAKEGIDFDKGDHASTFGGNNLSCAAANAVIDFILEKSLMENAAKQGNYFMKKLNRLKNKHNMIKEVRGKGLMIAVELGVEVKDIADKCLEKGLLVNCATDNVLRFLPPLIIKKKEINEAIKILDEVL